LGERIDQIMLGEITIEDMMMSVCPSFSGDWGHAWTKQTKGFKTPTLAYRKICDLEQDDRYRAYLRQPLFQDIARRLIGDRVNLVRAMYFAKPAESGGVPIDWHQDGGIAEDITIWTAIDRTSVSSSAAAAAHICYEQALTDLVRRTEENGCLQIAPRSHHFGKIDFSSTTSNTPTLSPENEAKYTAGRRTLPMGKGDSPGRGSHSDAARSVFH
jgi:hypothetical protein